MASLKKLFSILLVAVVISATPDEFSRPQPNGTPTPISVFCDTFNTGFKDIVAKMDFDKLFTENIDSNDVGLIVKALEKAGVSKKTIEASKTILESYFMEDGKDRPKGVLLLAKAVICEYQETCRKEESGVCAEAALFAQVLPLSVTRERILSENTFNIFRKTFEQLDKRAGASHKDLLDFLGLKEYYNKNCTNGQISLECFILRTLLKLTSSDQQ